MTRILGIDPGSRITGFGVIETLGNKHKYIACGSIKVTGEALPERLKVIYKGIEEVLKTYQPDEVSVEQVFMQRNVDSALKLGQARGAAICAAVLDDRPVWEYTPARIKQSVVGKGNADKKQVQHMVCALLNLNEAPAEDAADGLAIALCHSHTQMTETHMHRMAVARC